MLAMARMLRMIYRSPRHAPASARQRRPAARRPSRRPRSSVVSWRKISSRLRRERPELEQAPAAASRPAGRARGGDPRRCWQSISKPVMRRRAVGRRVTRGHAGHAAERRARRRRRPARRPARRCVWLPCEALGQVVRACRSATTLPLLMITTRSQVCETSGRMCVLRMIVWLAGETLDQVAGLHDLLRVEAGGRLVEDQHLGVVQDRLGQPDALR